MQGFYWPTMKKDSEQMVMKYDRCQKFGHVIHNLVEDLNKITNLLLFVQWGIDIVGPQPLALAQKTKEKIILAYYD